MSTTHPVIQILADKSQRPDVVDADKITHCLCQSGLVLLRGFDINLADFEAFTRRLCDAFHPSAKACGFWAEELAQHLKSDTFTT